MTQITIAAGTTVTVSLARGNSIRLLGLGQYRIATPLRPDLAQPPRAYRLTNTAVGPFDVDTTVQIVAQLESQYHIIGGGDVVDRDGGSALQADEITALSSLVLAGGSLATAIELLVDNTPTTINSTNTAADTTTRVLKSCSLPAGLLGPNGIIICQFEVSSTDPGTRNCSLGFLSGSTVSALSVEVSMASGATRFYQQELAAYMTSLAAQKYRGSLQRNGVSTAGFVAASMDHSVDQTLVLGGRWLSATAGSSITAESVRIYGVYGA